MWVKHPGVQLLHFLNCLMTKEKNKKSTLRGAKHSAESNNEEGKQRQKKETIGNTLCIALEILILLLG